MLFVLGFFNCFVNVYLFSFCFVCTSVMPTSDNSAAVSSNNNNTQFLKGHNVQQFSCRHCSYASSHSTHNHVTNNFTIHFYTKFMNSILLFTFSNQKLYHRSLFQPRTSVFAILESTAVLPSVEGNSCDLQNILQCNKKWAH